MVSGFLLSSTSIRSAFRRCAALLNTRYDGCAWPTYCMGKGSPQRDSNVNYLAFGPDEFEPDRAPAPIPPMPRDSSGHLPAEMHERDQSANGSINAAWLGSRSGQSNAGGGRGGDVNGDGLTWEVRYSSASGGKQVPEGGDADA